MNKLQCISFIVAIAGVTFLSCSGFAAQPVNAAAGMPTGSAYGRVQDHWDDPPSEFDEVSRKGFRDGIEGARKDY